MTLTSVSSGSRTVSLRQKLRLSRAPTIYIEVGVHMKPVNEGLEEADNFQQKISGQPNYPKIALMHMFSVFQHF